MTIEHTSTIEIDAPEGYVTAKAYFEIYNETANLYLWDFNDRPQSHEILVCLVGIDEVRRIEELVYTEWMESER